MIVCKLMGGLGNQMFQYAYTYALAQKMNEKICYDLSFYGNREPELFKFNIQHRLCLEDCRPDDYKNAVLQEKAYHVIQKFIRTLNHEKIGKKLFQYYSEKGYYFNFDPFYYPSIACEKKNKYVYGYFQSEKYFENVKSSIKTQFWMKEQFGKVAREYAKQINAGNSVALHVRLGDYTKRKNRYLNVCTDYYYENAIRYIEEHVDCPQFFIFSDEIDIVKQKNYIPDQSVFIEGTQIYEDFSLMRSCKHFIISGSTFSWWGAYLSESEGKIMVAPDTWMTTLRDEPAIYLQDMVRVSCRIEK